MSNCAKERRNSFSLSEILFCCGEVEYAVGAEKRGSCENQYDGNRPGPHAVTDR